MKKIMFNDKYGLTQAVLEGKKTQTRRISAFTLHEGDLQGELKQVYPDEIFTLDDKWFFNYKKHVFHLPKKNYPRYKVGEVVAVAQNYKDAANWALVGDCQEFEGKDPWELAAWGNKMFARADYLPHQIRITNVRIQRLQDISDEDCLAEGIIKNATRYCFKEKVKQTTGDVLTFSVNFDTPREAYAALIDKISGKGTWDSSPWVWAYTFELVK